MDDKRAEQHEQAVNYWRSVEQQGPAGSGRGPAARSDSAVGRGR